MDPPRPQGPDRAVLAPSGHATEPLLGQVRQFTDQDELSLPLEQFPATLSGTEAHAVARPVTVEQAAFPGPRLGEDVHPGPVTTIDVTA